MAFLGWGCGDDEPAPQDDPPVRCNSSSECADLEQVCRQSICEESPACESQDECEPDESCVDTVCAYDPDRCVDDEACDDGQICESGACREGCRIDDECDEIEECTSDLVCSRRSCLDVPCDEGYDCIEDTGVCQLRPCNGGCDEPLQCREEDDQCVVCMSTDECALAESCNEDGNCQPDHCEVHDDCPEGTFCISTECLPPPDCTDDSWESNNEYDDGNLLAEGVYTGMVSCPYDDDYYQVVADDNHSLTVALTFSHDQGDVQLELFNTVGVLFARRITDTDDESVTVNVGKTGVYTVRVWQDAGTEGVDYDLDISVGTVVEVAPDLCVDDAFEPNEDVDNATAIFSGRWTGMSVCDSDEDFYDLPAEPGEQVEICVTPSELADVRLGVELIATGEGVIQSNAGGTTFCVEDDLVAGTAFYARIFAPATGEETPYHVTFDITEGCRLFDDSYDQDGLNDHIPFGDDPPLVVLQGEDLPAELRLCPEDSDYWPVEMLWRDTLSAAIDFVHEDGDLQMKLHRPDGTVRLGSSGRTDREAIEFQAETSGIYYLNVYGDGEDMGAYTFDYTVEAYCEEDDNEPNDTAGDAVALAEGTTTDLWLCNENVDYFSFAIPTGTDAAVLTISIDFDDDGGTLSLEATPPGAEATSGTPSAGGAEVVFSDADVVVGDDQLYVVRVSGDALVENEYSLTIDVTEAD